jgi:class 3 adenylate cyclase/DNA-binding CsgD family transcriptional regulator
VTFVLTDVVGSTELWETVPDAMSVSLARHDEIVAAAVSAAGGVLLKTKGEGDSTFSVFARASDGVRAAYRMQRALREETWPAEAAIRVRAAVHSGEAVERDGDYFGPAVNLVARLRGAAQAGQILVSATTAGIVRKSLPPGCDLTEVGPFELRGIDDRVAAWALVSPDLQPVVPRRVADGRAEADGRRVSRREAEVLSLIGEALANAEIAERLYISERTVDSHVSSLLRKLGAGDRRELGRLAATFSSAPDAAPARPPLPATLELLADAATFVGREGERAELRRLWQLTRDGHTLMVVISGEAGIGKSRLVSELATDVYAGGGRVLFGACYEDVDEPYGPFAQMIAASLTEHLDLGGLAEDDRQALARLSPELARELAGSRDVPPPVTEQGLVFDAVERWLFHQSSMMPSLVVVEDLHWSTSSTRDLVRHLTRRAGHQPLLLVVTTRDTQPDMDAGLGLLLGDLERSPAVTRLTMSGLHREEIVDLLQVDATEAEAILADTGGNPLLVTQGSAVGHNRTLTALLTRRDELLDGDSRAVVDLAATFGSEFDADLLAAGHGAGLLQVLDALELAESAGWVVPLPGRPGRFGFVHALFRAHRYDQLSPRRRLELHASAAAALATRAGAVALVSERARHACLSVPITDARVAVELAREAAHDAEHACAYDEAAAHYRRGLDAAGALDPPDPHTTLTLTVHLGAMLSHRGDASGLPMLLDAAQRARDEGDVDALARVAISFMVFGASGSFGGPDPEKLAVIEDALATVGPEPTATLARLLNALANEICDVRFDEAVELLGRAEAIAREIGDDDVLGQVLTTVSLCGDHPSRLTERERVAGELLRLGAQQRSLALTLHGTFRRASTHLDRGDLDAWRDWVGRAERLLGDRSLALFQVFLLAHRAKRSFLAGDLDGAERVAVSTATGSRALGWRPSLWSGPALAAIRRMQARDREWLPRRSSRTTGSFAGHRFRVAAATARMGSTSEAQAMLSDLRAEAYRMPGAWGWSSAMSELAEAAEVVGDADAAAHVLAECSDYGGGMTNPGTFCDRPFDQALAQAALAVGDSDLAERHAAAAVTASRTRDTPLFLARELVFLAEARRRRGAPEGELRSLVAEASALAERFGARVVTVDLDRYGLPS